MEQPPGRLRLASVGPGSEAAPSSSQGLSCPRDQRVGRRARHRGAGPGAKLGVLARLPLGFAWGSPLRQDQGVWGARGSQPTAWSLGWPSQPGLRSP